MAERIFGLKKDIKKQSPISFPIFQTMLVLLLAFLFGYFIMPMLTPEQTTTEKTQGNAEFEKFCNDLFQDAVSSDQLALNYTLTEPDKYGIEKTSTSLGSYRIEDLKKEYRADRELFNHLKEFSTEKLSKDQQMLFQILVHETRLSLEKEPYLLYAEPLRPQSGVTFGLPVILSEYCFRDETDIKNYLSLIETLPDYFESIIEFEQEKERAGLFMNDTWKEKILHQCKSFIESGDNCILITSFDERMDTVSFPLTKQEVRKYKEKNRNLIKKEVFCSYRLLANELRLLHNEASQKTSDEKTVSASGMGSTESGKKYYELMVRSTTNSDRPVTEIEKLIDQSITDLKGDLKKNLSDPNVILQLDHYQFPSNQPETCLELLKTESREAFTPLETIASQHQIEIPTDTIYTVKKVMPSLQEFLSPAFYLTPPLDNSFDNIIYINPHYKNENLFTTLGHEGYPGHMYQMVYFNLQQKHPLRYILSFPGYSEGWGLYAEAFSYQFSGLSEDLSTVLKDQLLLSMAFYSKADIGVNYNCWTYEDMVNYFSEYGIAEHMDLEALYETMLEEPCLYLKYYVGYLEIEALRKEQMEQLGSKFSIRRFHDRLLSIGPAPFSLIRQEFAFWETNE